MKRHTLAQVIDCSGKLMQFSAVVLVLSACTGTPVPGSSSSEQSHSSVAQSSSLASSSDVSSSQSSKQSSSSVVLSSSSSSVVVSSAPVSSSSASSSLQASSSSVPAAGCDDRITKGKNNYANNCAGCHGEVPTDGTTVWSKGSNSIDVFDSGNDGYQPRDGGKQMLPLNDFIAMYMPNTSNGIGQTKGDNITAYITDAVAQPWCPGDEWPEPEQGVSSSTSNNGSSSSIASGDLSNYQRGALIYSINFNDGERKQLEGGDVTSGGLFSLATAADADHGSTATLYSLADWNRYDADDRANLAASLPNDWNNTMVQFHAKLVAGNSFNVRMGDRYASKYTHAGHISRITFYTSSVEIRDDIGGIFGLKQVEKSLSGDELDAVEQQYYRNYEQTKRKRLGGGNFTLAKDTWYTIRVVFHESLVELHMAEKGQALELILSFDSPGQVEGHLPQPKVNQAQQISRNNVQSRGHDHFKSRLGWTVPQQGEVHIDNLKIWTVTPE